MKLKLYYIVFLFCLSCNEASKQDRRAIVVEGIFTKDSVEVIEVASIDRDLVNKDEIIEECIFDQVTQTDEFLKDIKELEGYVWDKKTKTAEIVLNDHWSLIIKRGGCDHFEMSASFFYERVLDIEKDKKQIFDSIIWITSLLEEFDGEDIKRVIDEGKISFTKRDEFNYHANFMDVKLYELYYFNFNNEERTTFDIGYYYN